jgi:LysM repeat protein/Tfp pilus assembly protein PilO
MNTDVKDLFRRFKIKNPLVVGAVLSLIVALVLSGVVFSALVRAISRRSEAQSEYDTAQEAIAQIQRVQAAAPETLRQRLGAAQQQLQQLTTGWPTGQQVADEMAQYYQYASTFGVRLARLEPLLKTPEEEAEKAYNVQRFLVEARGEVPGLLRFLARLADGPFKTFLLDNLIVKPDGPFTGNVDLAVYSIERGTLPAPAQGTPSPAPTATPAQQGSLMESFQAAIAAQDWPAAAAQGERLLQEEPEHQEVTYQLYQVYLAWGRELAAKGRRAEAQQRFEAALRLVPNGQEALTLLRGLQGTPTFPAARPTITRPGQTAKPSPTAGPTKTPTPEVLIHVVRPGDTLWSIASRYHTTVSAIMRANDLRSTTVYVGQRLVIPR